ncbi:ANTAR domain-containing protein [Mycobacterium kubicae]|nr:ANTAR domain-containing protein [Mycobacterium kubicae]MCV7093793.1 GAF and ANTAR domain-containing protein [Mycobacterium kubicae]QNI10060.1 GAF and ANTAR domain-containing protein [Mycobacterium kubicae]QPI38263.1 GAF and ANTAR domain-containing protein [Mycobacterium kubicae]
MSDLAEQSTAGTGVNRALGTVTAGAVRLIRGAECADLMLIDGERFESVAPTAAFVTELDAVQMQYGRGPCLEAALDDPVIRVPDLAREGRWPEFTAAATARGVRSVLTFQIHRCQHCAGALNVYGCAAGTFTVEDEAIGAMLAAHAAIALLAHQKAAALDSMDDRDVLGQAKGILMERFKIDATRAMQLIAARSKDANASIKSIAHDIISFISE